jgi:geranylgeranyl diphosphate/geranylgeranyl-bacteriochlorophyllide a reductase
MLAGQHVSKTFDAAMQASTDQTFDVAVVGGGPAGATAAHDLALAGRKVALIDRAGRIKPCGGAIPPRAIRDFAIPEDQIVARIKSARMIAPSSKTVDMPIDGGMVGMVDREHFDEFLRVRAAEAGTARLTGRFSAMDRDADGVTRIYFEDKDGQAQSIRARFIIGADGANSGVAAAAIPKASTVKFVFAYHEIVRAPKNDSLVYDSRRCDVIYDGRFSPDFYSWVFPHGDTASIGTGSAQKGFSLRKSVAAYRKHAGLDELETIRHEGAPIPLKPMKRWDNGRDVLVVGDAAGVVAPASGEGIYYAMACGRMGADAVAKALDTGDARALAGCRKRFMKAHGKVFFALGILQWIWYRSDRLREKFVAICRDKDVQRLTWEAYMNKELVRRRPMAHARVFFKDIGHLLGFVRP